MTFFQGPNILALSQTIVQLYEIEREASFDYQPEMNERVKKIENNLDLWICVWDPCFVTALTDLSLARYAPIKDINNLAN